MRGIHCRSLRLELVAGLGIALALPALAVAAQAVPAVTSRGVATETSLSAETRDLGGSTQAHLFVTVIGQDGLPASGAVAIKDNGKDLAGAILKVDGTAELTLTLAAGEHQLRAVYAGDSIHHPSRSNQTGVHALITGVPDFSVSVAPTTLTLTAGQTGTLITSITPQNAASLQGPMFVTLSCSGNPDQSSCTFTPESVEILQGATAAVTSSMVFQTQSSTNIGAAPVVRHTASPIAWAILFPGALGLLGIALGGRRRRWLSRVSLIALIGLVTTLGTTGCNPLYYYQHHGPPPNPPTPAGSYTVKVTAQSTNGVTAITHSTTLALTVK